MAIDGRTRRFTREALGTRGIDPESLTDNRLQVWQALCRCGVDIAVCCESTADFPLHILVRPPVLEKIEGCCSQKSSDSLSSSDSARSVSVQLMPWTITAKPYTRVDAWAVNSSISISPPSTLSMSLLMKSARGDLVAIRLDTISEYTLNTMGHSPGDFVPCITGVLLSDAV